MKFAIRCDYYNICGQVTMLFRQFVPWNFHSRSQSNVVSLPNTNYDYLIDKLTTLRCYGLFISLYLYSFIVVKDG